MSRHPLLAAFLLVAIAVGCDSSGSPGENNDDDDDNDNGGGVASTYAQVDDVAKMIYDAVEASEDVSPHIEAVLEAFGVPVLALDDVAGAQARIDAGLPFVTTLVVTRMAEAYAGGSLVDAKGFAEGLVEQNVGLAFPYNQGGQDLDEDFLGGLLYVYNIAGPTEPDVPLNDGYVLPALVWTLGQERARRINPNFVDPTWGDGRLDPLQFTLLSFTIFGKPAAPARTSLLPGASGLDTFVTFQTNPAADFIKDKIKDQIKDKVEGEITSAVQELVEVPLDKKDAAKVSVCGSLILYGHKISMTNTPDLLWRAPLTPNFTQIDLTLTFEDDYYDGWARAVLGSAVTDLTGCAFPRKGPIEGKGIEWSVSSALESQGSFDVTQPSTDEFGRAVATWRTFRDEIPQACQVFDKQRDAVGATEAVVSGLLPGWSTVETIVTFLNPNTGGQGNAPLTVLYYEVTTNDPCHNE